MENLFIEDPVLTDFPFVSLELVEALEKLYPDRAPSIRTPERQLWTDVGHVEVVRFLRDMATNRSR